MAKNYALDSAGKKWGGSAYGTSGGTVYYSFWTQNFGGEGFNFSSQLTAEMKNEVRAAFARWESVADIHFVEVTDTAVQVNGGYRFGVGAIDGPYNGTSGVALATQHEQTYPDNTIKAAETIFDSAEGWHTVNGKVYDAQGHSFYAMALESIGRELGLAYYNGAPEIMNNPPKFTITDLQAGDIAGIQYIYGGKPSSDLTISLKSLSVASDGRTVDFDFTIKNGGSLPVGANLVGLYMSDDATITTDDTLLSYNDFGSIGGSSGIQFFTDATHKLILDNAIPGGTHYLGFVVDYSNAVSESNEGNNASKGIKVVSKTPAPDLTASKLAVTPTTVSFEGNVHFSYDVRNAGTLAASATHLGFFLSTDSKITTSDKLLLDFDRGSTDAGEMFSAGFDIPLDALYEHISPGKYYLGIIVNYDNVISESNTKNNTSNGVAITVTGPGPLFTAKNDTVDFNGLSPEQASSVRSHGGDGIYDALAGDDTVTLPLAVNYELTTSVTWDSSRTFFAGDGRDTVLGGVGNDIIDGGNGNDVIWGGHPILLSLDGNDMLHGGAGDDELHGGGFNDSLYGDLGSDVLYGNSGDDTLNAVNPKPEKASDHLDGGSGNDNFLIDSGDTIASIELGDTIYLVCNLTVDRAAIYYDGVSDKIVAFNDTYGIAGTAYIEQGVNAKYLDGVIGDNLTGGSSLIITMRSNITDPFQSLSTDAGQFKDNLLLAVVNLKDAFYEDWQAQVANYITEKGTDAVGKEFAAYLLENVAFSAAKGSLHIFKSVCGVVQFAEVVSELAPVFVHWVNGDYADDLAVAEAFATALNNALNPLAATTGAAMKLGAVILKEAFAELMTTFTAPLQQFAQGLSNLTGTYTGDGNPDFININRTPGDGSAKGNGGNDTFVGGHGDGDDSYDGGKDVDTVTYFSTTTGITVDLAKSLAQGNEIGNDKLISIEDVYGGNGDDIIAGSSVTNYLAGEGGDDQLFGVAGNDTLDGGDDADVLIGGAGNDALNGGEGQDTASYADATKAVTISLLLQGLAQKTGAAGTDVLTGIEDLIGGSGNDILIGDDNANQIDGGNGNDTIEGGLGADTLDGGAGINTLSYSRDASGVTIDLQMMSGAGGDAEGDIFSNFQNITGGGGDDLLSGDETANRIDGGAGDDMVEGGDGNDVLIGGIGDDTVSYEHDSTGVTVSLSVTKLQKTVGEGSDTVSGFENLIGGSGNDTLTGDKNANEITGGDGDDLVIGGAGNDTLTGGSGYDLFRLLTSKDGTDLIVDFTAGEDQISIVKSGFALKKTVAIGTNDAYDFEQHYLVNDAVADDFVAPTETGHAQFLFNTTTHELYFDADGLGKKPATFVATLVGVDQLHGSDFELK
jgi:Ca2+-binding RTX toxin-like protein